MIKAKKNGSHPAHPNLYAHLTRNTLIGTTLILLMLFIGMLGYHLFEKMTWIDAFINASMILSGMGPISSLTTSAGKIFAGCYALVSGLAFVVIIAIIFSPLIHKFFRSIHLEEK